MKNKDQSYLKLLSRRKFLRNTVVATVGASVIFPFISGCSDEDFIPIGSFGFFEGIASFDPDKDKVVLWTRYSQADNEIEAPVIILDVATDSGFSNLIASETVQVDTSSDNTVIVDVNGLNSNTKYYYRFRSELTEATSLTGETRTLPENGEISELKLAVVSCANFQAGLFNVYGAVAESDAEFVIHLGDYIYEYPIGGFGSNDFTSSLGREHEPAGELFTIDDYRARYRQYRSDEQLREAHRLKPFICVWDDHEIANNAYKEGAENHQPSEGDFEIRKMNALQAWHEYLPARVDNNAKIYRNFDFGGLVNLMMLDTRIIGRDKQLNYLFYLTPDGVDSDAFIQDWQNPSRTILGSEQRAWLTNQLASNTATWQLLGSQVVMAKYYVPFELLALIAEIATLGVTPELITQYSALATELVAIKTRILQGDPTVTEEERNRVENAFPYNLDAWDGYPIEREEILAAANNKKLIAIAGDTHNAWYGDLTDLNGNKVGAEFATASVSSPGFEGVFGGDPSFLHEFAESNSILIDDLNYVNPTERGYLKITFNESMANAEWLFVNTILSKDTSTITGNMATEV